MTGIYEALVTPMAAYNGNTDVSEALVGFPASRESVKLCTLIGLVSAGSSSIRCVALNWAFSQQNLPPTLRP
ncbi:MAG: hypothetical protein Aurels2KO_28820 [Aureliella sp.]